MLKLDQEINLKNHLKIHFLLDILDKFYTCEIINIGINSFEFSPYHPKIAPSV